MFGTRGALSPMRVPSIVGLIVAAALAAALGCGPKTTTVVDASRSPQWPCTILPPSAAAPDTICIALFESVDWSHAPIPRSEAEHLVFSQLFDEAFATECKLTTGAPYQVAAVTTRAIVLAPSSDTTLAVIKFVDCRGRDARDLFDESSIDVMFVDDQSISLYAQRQERFTVLQLPAAAKSYVLLATSRAAAVARGEELAPLPDSLINELASRAVRDAYAEPIGDHAWWDDLQACDSSLVKMPNGYDKAEGRILYDASDPVARDLAERIVSLASGTSPSAGSLARSVPGLANRQYGVTALGVTGEELGRRVSWGYADLAFVFALPSEVMDGCRAGLELTSAAPWLGGRPMLSKVLLPLVSTRSIAIVLNRQFGTAGNGVGLSCDRFGNVRIYGWSKLDNLP